MMKQKNNLFLITILLLLAITSRFLSMPSNFSILGAIALFSGACITNKVFRFALPMVLLFVSDLLLNNLVYAEYYESFTFFYSGAFFSYAAYALAIIIGSLLTKTNSLHIIGGSVGAAVVFFVLSNFGVWATTAMYAKTFSGLLSCYEMAIPFFKNSLASNLVFSTLLFGAYHLATKNQETRALG
ncbi:MAG: DUF6580 family putative transport protein [Cyclobacteriaceae bacterium]